jgi:hypothetical protein
MRRCLYFVQDDGSFHPHVLLHIHISKTRLRRTKTNRDDGNSRAHILASLKLVCVCNDVRSQVNRLCLRCAVLEENMFKFRASFWMYRGREMEDDTIEQGHSRKLSRVTYARVASRGVSKVKTPTFMVAEAVPNSISVLTKCLMCRARTQQIQPMTNCRRRSLRCAQSS